jgi:hypothetical protein
MRSGPLIIAAIVVMSGTLALSTTGDSQESAQAGFLVSPVEKSADVSKTARLVTSDLQETDTAGFIIAQAETPTASSDQPAEQPVVDESALRYFASKGDKVRLEAEIARLRALYPNWTPPADPLAVPENADRQIAAMWKLYADSKFQELRKAILDRQTVEPGWAPPSDLLDRLAVAEKRLNLVAASDAKRYQEVIDIGAVTPSLLTCSDVDMLWRVAEAFVGTDRPSRANDVYSYILRNCAKQPERLATMQKASVLLGYGRMQALMRLGKKLPDGSGEFEPIRDDLTRRFVAEGGKNAALVIDSSYLERLDKLLASGGKASDALLLGWYHMARKAMAPAARYFRTAREIEDSASASQGLALTLIAAKDPRQAEDVMYRWRDSSKAAAATYFAATAHLLAIQPPPVIDGAVLARMAAAVTGKKEVTSAEEFGWYALAFKQPRTASQWFGLVLDWKADHEPAAYGLAVARLQLRDMAGVRQIQKLWEGRSLRIAAIADSKNKRRVLDDIPSANDTGAAARNKRKRPRAVSSEEDERSIDLSAPARNSGKVTVRGCSASIDPESLSHGAALCRGWCLMELNRPVEAAAAFGVALHSASDKTREDAAYGQSLAYLRAGLVDQAAVAATKARQGVKRAVELQTAILADRAVNAFDAARYRETLLYLDQLAQLQTERSDLMVLRAYSYRRLERRAEAIRIFEALAATGNRDAIKGLGEIRAESTPN